MELEADPDENERICRDEEENTNEYTQKGWNKSRNRNTKKDLDTCSYVVEFIQQNVVLKTSI